VNCIVCKGPMKPLFSGSFCPNDCDRRGAAPPTPKVWPKRWADIGCQFQPANIQTPQGRLTPNKCGDKIVQLTEVILNGFHIDGRVVCASGHNVWRDDVFLPGCGITQDEISELVPGVKITVGKSSVSTSVFTTSIGGWTVAPANTPQAPVQLDPNGKPITYPNPATPGVGGNAPGNWVPSPNGPVWQPDPPPVTTTQPGWNGTFSI
jgi:hypothetical protein